MKLLKIGFFLLFINIISLQAQHRGDNLGFQGLEYNNYNGVIPVALGGAFTARSGNISSLFWNPAGLIGISNIEVDFEFKSANNQWRESQRYRPNRLMVTMPFYLEGWYIPKPENNGRWDHELAVDTSYTYTVNPTISGKDPYSEADADWIKKRNTSGIGHFSIAYPMKFMERDLVFAATYSRNINIQDFDRNDTYLAPHIGYTGYDGFLETVDETDTLNVDWFKYLRSRSGESTSYTGAVSLQLFESFQAGLSFNVFAGTTDDVLRLDKVGYFGLFDENEFFFSYDTLNTLIEGTSDYKATKFNLGFIYNLKNVDIGLNVQLPYTLERNWTYSKSITDTNGTQLSSISGKDKVELPAIWTFGINIRPIEKLSVSFDYEYAPYKNAKFKFASPDSLDAKWTSRTSLRLGLKYKLYDFISIMGGYRYTPQIFIPDGSALDDKGPISIAYSMGTSVNVLENIQLNAAYIIEELRYYDQYFSNTNYNTQLLNQLHIGLNYKL